LKTPNTLKRVKLDYLPIVQSLEDSVKRNQSDCLLLSGGLDTSILAYLAAKWHKPYCLTVAFKDAPAPDIEYARKIAARFNLEHGIHYFGKEELEDGICSAIKVLKSFDPMEIRNSAAAYVGLKTAAEMGLKTVMTGDGGDELFAGYSFFFDLDKEHLDAALVDLWENMHFSSIPLADSLGISARLPFLDPVFKTLAMNLDSGLKVRSENGRVYGKWILRKAFEKLISPEIAWRVKAPLEVGTGTTILPELFEKGITNLEFHLKKTQYLESDNVRLTSKEHLHYYEIYKKLIGVPGLRAEPGRKCPGCGSNVKEKTNYCPTCGAYPI
jgi:asparagine synthase (glutamine-hydrolysing)